MKVLVTGGLGHVGGVVARHLMQFCHEVLVVDDGRNVADGVDLPVDCVVREPVGAVDHRMIDDFAPDVVMYLAASALVKDGEAQPLDYAQNNVTELVWFLESLMRSRCRRIIYAGSCSVYGIPEKLPLVESHPTLPVSFYGWTKLMAERLIAQVASATDLKFLTFRFFNAVGAGYGIAEGGRSREHVVPQFVEAVREGRPLRVNGTDHPTPDGTCIRDYVHVLDIAEAHMAAAARLVDGSLANEVVNLGTGVGTSLFELIERLRRVTGTQFEAVNGPRLIGDSPVLVASAEKAQRLLGWKATRTLDQAIVETWERAAARSSAKTP